MRSEQTVGGAAARTDYTLLGLLQGLNVVYVLGAYLSVDRRYPAARSSLAENVVSCVSLTPGFARLREGGRHGASGCVATFHVERDLLAHAPLAQPTPASLHAKHRACGSRRPDGGMQTLCRGALAALLGSEHRHADAGCDRQCKIRCQQTGWRPSLASAPRSPPFR